jgi:hypothetical protein
VAQAPRISHVFEHQLTFDDAYAEGEALDEGRPDRRTGQVTGKGLAGLVIGGGAGHRLARRDERHFTVTRISKADSPKDQGVWVAGDDTSAIWLTHDRFYAAWGDWRTGSLQTYWGGFSFR